MRSIHGTQTYITLSIVGDIGNDAKPQQFVICAKLENVGNVESIGNSKTDLAALPDIKMAIETLSNSTNKCDAGGGTGECFFCVTSSQ